MRGEERGEEREGRLWSEGGGSQRNIPSVNPGQQMEGEWRHLRVKNKDLD